MINKDMIVCERNWTRVDPRPAGYLLINASTEKSRLTVQTASRIDGQVVLASELARLHDKLENERSRLLACGVAAVGCIDGWDYSRYDSRELRDVLALRAENERLRAEIIAVRERNELLEKWRTNWYAPIITPTDRQRQERAIAALGADPALPDARLGTLAR